MSRFIVLSDVHLHNGWKHTSLKVQKDNLFDLVGYCNNNGIKTILFCGDMFHTHGTIKTEVLYVYNEFIELTKTYGINIIGIAGNHDHADKEGRITGLNSIGTLLDQTAYGLEDIPIVGLTYSDEDRLRQFLNKDLPSDSILLLHQGVSGVEVNSKGFTLNEALRPDMIPNNILHCFTGHYHTHKAVSNNLTIPGALGQYIWSDANEERGFLDVFVEGKSVHIRRINSLNWKQFEIIDYSQVGCYRTEDMAPNLKIKNVPSKKIAEELTSHYRQVYADEDWAELGSNIECEIIAPETTSAEMIKSESFSTADFFEEYSIARNLSKEYIDFGRKLIST